MLCPEARTSHTYLAGTPRCLSKERRTCNVACDGDSRGHRSRIDLQDTTSRIRSGSRHMSCGRRNLRPFSRLQLCTEGTLSTSHPGPLLDHRPHVCAPTVSWNAQGFVAVALLLHIPGLHVQGSGNPCKRHASMLGIVHQSRCSRYLNTRSHSTVGRLRCTGSTTMPSASRARGPWDPKGAWQPKDQSMHGNQGENILAWPHFELVMLHLSPHSQCSTCESHKRFPSCLA